MTAAAPESPAHPLHVAAALADPAVGRLRAAIRTELDRLNDCGEEPEEATALGGLLASHFAGRASDLRAAVAYALNLLGEDASGLPA